MLRTFLRHIFCMVLFTQSLVYASGQFNWLRPYDTLLLPDQQVCSGLQAIGYAEFGLTNARGYNLQGDPTSVLCIWDGRQDAISMLYGFNQDSAIGQKLIEIDATPTLTRGQFSVQGDLKMNWTFALAGRYFFWEHLCLSAYMPFYGMQLKDVYWCDLTPLGSLEDLRVHEDLTDAIAQNVFELGNGLQIGGWKRQGPGDLVIMLEFMRDFKQQRPMLKNVGLHGRLGLNLPTGVRQNEDLIFAVPFGYDGAAGIFGAGGIDILISYVLELGLDVELLHLFGNTQQRRIKTDIAQTELLLLAKVNAYKDYGLLQRFNLYAKAVDLFGPVSLKLGYQFFKQDSNQLAFSSCEFSPNIANTAKSLAQWTMHHVYLIADYNFAYHSSCDDDYWNRPYLSLFARIPFKGRNIALIPTMGVVASWVF